MSDLYDTMEKHAKALFERLPAPIKTSLRFCYRVVHNLETTGGLEHAATVAFFALLSILPFVLLAVNLISRFATTLPWETDDARAIENVLNPLRHAVPFIGGSLQELVVSLAQRRTDLGVVSFVTLLIAASAGFNAVSSGVNAVLGTEKRRQYLLTRLLVAGLVLAMIAVVFVAQAALEFLELWAAAANLTTPKWLNQADSFGLAVEMGLLAWGFYVLVRFTATERFPRKWRWTGAIVFTVFFELAQAGFGVYLDHLTTYDRFYGAAGAFFGLALWLYVAGIVLLGACSVIRTLSEFEQGLW